jgi:nitrate reductase cytochrome c-type subunit
VAYSSGQQVTYEGQTYTCTQAHTSQSDWTPSSAPTLWTASSPPWSAGGNAYSVGDCVSYTGSIYQCIQSHSSQDDWNPSSTASLWNAVASCP